MTFVDFPFGSTAKESTCNEGDLGSIPGLGRSHGERKGYPLQYSGLENSMDAFAPPLHGPGTFPASSVHARVGAGCRSMGDVSGA